MQEKKLHEVSRISRRILALIALLSGLTAAHAAELPSLRIQLRNGDTLSGQLLSENTTNLVLRTSWAATLSVPKAEVAKREALPANPPAAAAVPKPAPVVAAKPLAPVLKPVPPKPAPSPAAKPKSEWAVDLEVGADLAFSTRDRSLYHGRIRLTHSYIRLRNAAEYRSAYGESQGLVTENRMDASLKSDFDLNQRKVFVYNLAGLSFDNSRASIANSLGTMFFLFIGIVIFMILLVEARSSFFLQFQSFLIFILVGSIGLYASLTVASPGAMSISRESNGLSSSTVRSHS